MDSTKSDQIKHFLQVAYSGDISEFNRLMSQLSLEVINQPDDIGKTALILAAEDGHLEKVNALIHAGVNLNAQCYSGTGKTALMCATEKKHAPVVEALLKAKAKTGLKTLLGDTFFTLAKKTKDDAILKLLDEHYSPILNAVKMGEVNTFLGLMPNYDVTELNVATNMYGETILVIAARLGHLQIVNRLIQVKVDLNKVSFDGLGYTALMIAIKKGHTSVAEVLFQEKADVTIVNPDGESVSSLIQQSPYKPILEAFLKKYGIDIIKPKIAPAQNADVLMQTFHYFTSWISPVPVSTTPLAVTDDAFVIIEPIASKHAPKNGVQ
jgi:ankyrin repeat protein